MSENPQKVYRWFTGTPRNLDNLAYPVSNFESLFPTNSPGIWRESISPSAAKVFTHNFDNAMQALQKNNNGHLDLNTLDGADIAFTLDNGDTHDLTCRIRMKKDLKGGLITDYTIIDSIPAVREKQARPSQENTLRNLPYLIKAWFKDNKMPEPHVNPGQIIHSDLQVNGYCTSLAIYQMVDDLSKAPLVKIENDSQGKISYNTLGYQEFNSYLKDKIIKAGHLLPHIPSIAELIMFPNQFVEDLVLAYQAVRMDGINTVEGNIRDHYETLPHSKLWEQNVDKAYADYSNDAHLRTLYHEADDYVKAKISDWRLTPVSIDGKLGIMDRREVARLQSKERLEEKITTYNDYIQRLTTHPVPVRPNLNMVIRRNLLHRERPVSSN